VGDLRAVRADPYSIFYRPTGTTIQIIRVLHERQDIPPILGDEHQ